MSKEQERPEEEQLEPKVRMDSTFFLRIPVTVSMTLTAQEWEAFKVATEKSGGSIARKICEAVQPALLKLTKARAVLNNKEEQ